MTHVSIIEVNETNFEYEVLAYSQNVPVIVDFWAEWCQPCKILGPLLEKIIMEESGELRLAKVNIDQNPNLAIQYGVRSIPTIKAFTQGNVVAEFVGAQPEERIREFIKKLTPPSPVDLAVEKADNLLLSFQWSEAEKIYREALTNKSNIPAGLLGLAKALISQGKSKEALAILEDFPSSKLYAQAQTLIPLAQAMGDQEQEANEEEKPLEPAFQNCLRLISQGKLQPAMDGLLDILRQDKNYRERLAHKVAIAVLEMMGESNEITRQYRAELASVLF